MSNFELVNYTTKDLPSAMLLCANCARGRCEDTSDDAVLTVVVVEYIDVERLDEKVETGGRVEEEGTVIVAIDGDGRVESG
ncbi:hypothetical protein P5673_018051 [Acropora cervicornis]|uniref:Uncharacterized protein n=1 Tax=Acropora cervicornis TaxID=6130 RepID=A0AAD9QDZ7_ACRCE|nr:hypothetical protein P5673_018051 [Acropora cervicornis]